MLRGHLLEQGPAELELLQNAEAGVLRVGQVAGDQRSRAQRSAVVDGEVEDGDAGLVGKVTAIERHAQGVHEIADALGLQGVDFAFEDGVQERPDGLTIGRTGLERRLQQRAGDLGKGAVVFKNGWGARGEFIQHGNGTLDGVHSARLEDAAEVVVGDEEVLRCKGLGVGAGATEGPRALQLGHARDDAVGVLHGGGVGLLDVVVVHHADGVEQGAGERGFAELRRGVGRGDRVVEQQVEAEEGDGDHVGLLGGVVAGLHEPRHVATGVVGGNHWAEADQQRSGVELESPVIGGLQLFQILVVKSVQNVAYGLPGGRRGRGVLPRVEHGQQHAVVLAQQRVLVRGGKYYSQKELAELGEQGLYGHDLLEQGGV
ncbi:cyclic pyranopterin monophosphate synthase MoaC [Babesia caballi]|uniref:Cyclic pyranopterin monophosphate synthase MoaC n=1 Tax=Babesia caballi TaxID=5871 RepID=A0AAV4LLJ3_BABCB|nr:cyclic pyranopterin monophosphate synthase MoaC [Babesia caballi]